MHNNKFTLQDMTGDLKVYFNWSINMLAPYDPGAADTYLRIHHTSIIKIAQQLLKLTGYTPGLIYRGIILRKPVNSIAPHKNFEYLSFSTDRAVAEHFADINGFGSEIMDLASQLGTHCYVIEYTPKIEEILFHHQFLSILPYEEGFTNVGMDGAAEVEGLSKQKEVTILQPAEPLINITKRNQAGSYNTLTTSILKL